AGLVAVAALPAAVGLTSASYHDPAQFSRGFDRAAAVCAVLLVIAAVLAAVLVDNTVLWTGGRPGTPSEAPTCCPVGAPQLQPTPQRAATAGRTPSGTG